MVYALLAVVGFIMLCRWAARGRGPDRSFTTGEPVYRDDGAFLPGGTTDNERVPCER